MKRFILSVLLTLSLISAAFAAQPVTTKSSGNVANATATATIAAAPNNINYLTNIEIAFGGSTAGSCVNATITGLLGGTATYAVCAPAGALVSGLPITAEFVPPLNGAAINTAIVLTLPALGAGNTNASVTIHGYTE